MLLTVLSLLGAVGLFLFGLNTLSNGLLKLSGEKLRTFLPWMRKNPVNSILSGFCITTIAESSSAATVMVVGFVNAGAIALSQAILVIMGANVGASFTTWVIALFGFKIKTVAVIYTLVLVGFILSMAKGRKLKTAGEAVFGFSIMMLGVTYMLQFFPAIEELPALQEFTLSLSSGTLLPVLLYMAIGCVLAFLVQSTGAVTLTMVMFSAGWIDFGLAAAMVMGENIGTTISANIAATDANIPAKRAALVHTLFNAFVAVLSLIFFRQFISLIEWLVGGFHQSIWKGVLGIATFHTLFNLFGTCILAWFTKPIEKLVTLLVKESADGSDSDSKLIYISARQFGTPAISIDQAYKEVAHFGEVLYKGFEYVKLSVNEKDVDKFEEYRVKLVQLEETSDKMEYQIASFLNNVSTGQLSEDEANDIKILYRIIGEMESLGDSGENISRILERERVHNRKFDDAIVAKINAMIDVTDAAYRVMCSNLETASTSDISDIQNAYLAEDEINRKRDSLREESVNQIEQHSGNYQSLNYFLDIIAELEAMGDFMINISQSLVKKSR